MKILSEHWKDGRVKVRVENLDDLWYLSTILDPSDIVKAETERKLKIGDAETEKARIVRKKVYLGIRLEKVEFSKYTNTLRLLGTIVEGPDDIPRGTHHSLAIEERSELTIIKEEWLSFQKEKLKEASASEALNIIFVLFDREEALFGILKANGYEILSTLKGDVAKKGIDEKKAANFYKDIAAQLAEYEKRHKATQIIAASAAFWKEYLAKELSDDLRKKTTFATCSDVSRTGINELLKRPELVSVLAKDRSAREDALVDKVLQELSKGRVAYGLKEVKEKCQEGSVGEIILTDTFIQKERENERFKDIDQLLKLINRMKGKVHIISTDDAVKKIDGIGGIAGILRWT
ncbi:MAG: mRNA surveillance protein pelota [Nanoarchaeota archaeon]